MNINLLCSYLALCMLPQWHGSLRPLARILWNMIGFTHTSSLKVTKSKLILFNDSNLIGNIKLC